MKHRAVWILTGILAVIAVGLMVLIVIKSRPVKVVNTLNSDDVGPNPQSRYQFFYENKPSRVINETSRFTGEQITYIHNHDGLNNLNDYPLEKDGQVRIAAIGDSFTYGLNVSTKDNWVSRLQDQLNGDCKKKFEVLNFGVPGYDIDYVLERNRLRAEKYHPDTYVWFIKDDDFEESKELTIPIENRINISGKYNSLYHDMAIAETNREYGSETIIKNQEKHLFSYISGHPDSRFLLVLPKGSLTYPRISPSREKELSVFAKTHKNTMILPIAIEKKDIILPDDYHFNKEGSIHVASVLTSWLQKKYCP